MTAEPKTIQFRGVVRHPVMRVGSADLAALAAHPLVHKALVMRGDEFVRGLVLLVRNDAAPLIYEQGEEARWLFFIADGRVGLTAEVVPGEEGVIEILEAGQLIGEEAFIQGARLASARAIGPARLIALDPDLLLPSPRDLAAHFHGRMRGMAEEVVFLKTAAPIQRLARLLLSHFDGHDGGAERSFPLMKKCVAAKIGVDPVTLSRLLRRLKGIGVSVSGNAIKVRDLTALRALAAQAAPMRGFRRPLMRA